MAKVLIVDDEPGILYAFQRVFGGAAEEVLTASTVREGLQLFNEQRPDVLVLDLQLPDGTGMDIFEEVHAIAPKTPIVFITAHGTAQTAMEAMKRGAFDYLLKPVDFEQLRDLLRRAFEAGRLMHVPAVLPSTEPMDQIIGRSPIMQEMCKTIGRVAGQDINVLILGESGTGKELVARAIYYHSRRSDRPFLAINCAALPENLVESELFGHEKGSFTGADRKRIGKFEQANGGTLFLDEIGDMPLAAQAKILRLLQEQQFERVGGTEPVRTNVRVLAATNQNLEQLIERGVFRADLYYRLKGVTVAVPPLRDRDGDVLEMAQHFLFRFNRELGMSIQGFDAEALACLRQYRWPGNVRELQSVLKESMLRTAGPILFEENLPPHLLGKNSYSRVESAVEESDQVELTKIIDEVLQAHPTGVYDRVMQIVERALFTRILQETNGHQGQASERLGLNRSTLRYKLRELGLAPDRNPGTGKGGL